MHEIMEFCLTYSLALDNWEQKFLSNSWQYAKRLFNGLFHSGYLVFPKCLFSIADLFAVRYLWDLCTRPWSSAWHLLWSSTNSNSWQSAKPFTPCAARTIIFQRENLNYLMVCFTQGTLFFQNVCFLLPICLPCVICGTFARDHGVLRDIFFGARQTQTLGNQPNPSHQTLHTVCCEDDYFPKGKFKLFHSLFHSVYPVFTKRLFSFPDLFAVRHLWVVCNEDKCCVVTHSAQQTFASLSLFTFARIACLFQLWIRFLSLGHVKIIKVFTKELEVISR